LSRDPIGERSGINLYGYVGNNPLGYIDPLGLTSAGAIIGGRVGAWVGGVAGEAVDPLGGGVPGSVIGSLIGRSLGDWASDLIYNQSNHDSEDEYDDNNFGGRCPGKRGSGNGTPGNNQAQNKQFNDAAKGLNDDQRQRLHTAVSGKNYDYHAIHQIAQQIKNGKY
jgi:uncharacterized protein RhaS with RHS repeats